MNVSDINAWFNLRNCLVEGIKLQSEDDYFRIRNLAIKHELSIVLKFYFDACGPCKKIAPQFEQLMQRPDFVTNTIPIAINTQEQPFFATMFDIQSVPAFVYVDNAVYHYMKQTSNIKELEDFLVTCRNANLNPIET